MTPGARISAAITCLDAIFEGAPAEKTLTRWARGSRFAGSKDRAAVRDHVFDALRCRDSYCAVCGELTGRAVMIGLTVVQGLETEMLFNGQGHAPDPLSDAEKEQVAAHLASSADTSAGIWNMPEWCAVQLQASHGKAGQDIAQVLSQRAPVDLRVNAGKATLAEAMASLAQDGVETRELSHASFALRITQGARKLRASAAYLGGLVELQDAGSQALVAALPLADGQRVLDYCAGGGGKALAMSAQAGITCYAHDINPRRMQDIPERAARAGVKIDCLDSAQTRSKAPFDLVLCDAPCSGSGAWRRSPDAKWRLTPDALVDLLSQQAEILNSAVQLVRPGGVLAYATCSLFTQENEQQVTAFLKDNPDLALIYQKSWTPLDDVDGFHLSIMTR